MDSDSWIRVILLAFLTIGAAYCAASEISYAAMNKIRIKSFAENGDKRAIKAMYISDNFDRALTTLLIGNNITHIAFGSLATLLATQLWGVKSVKYTTVVSAIFVFLVSEMIPKSYAKANSESFALTVSHSLSFLMRALAPVSAFFMSIGGRISSLFPKAAEPAITEEEFLDIIETAEEEGVLDKDKQELVNSALNFDVITAGDIYTGRDKILALDVNSTYQEILQVIKTHKYSRLPVYQDSLDNIVGILHARDFLKCYLRQEKPDIRELLIDVHFVSEKTRIDDLLRDMSSKKIHMSVVTDGSGKTLGIVTVEDILEELVGEIFDEDDVAHEKHARLSVKQPESSYRPKALNVAKAPNAAKTLIAEKATDVAKMPDAAKMPITAKTPDAAKATNFARALNAAKSPDTAKAQYSTSAPDATKAPDSAKGTDVAKTPNATIAMN